MAKLLRNLLGGHEPVFSLRLKSLEMATGNHKVDLLLLSDVLSGLGKKIKSLGLDPSDTTPAELHSSLVAKAETDDDELSRSFQKEPQKIIDKLLLKLPLTPVPVVKSAVLKKILVANPPKRVMTALGYRSTDSLLKRTPIEQVLVGSFLLEHLKWHRQFAKSLKNLSSSDMTMERPKAVLVDPRLMSGRRYGQVVSLQCAGLVGVPKFAIWPGSSLLTATLASEGLFHMHVRGVLLKLNRFDEDCIKKIAHFTYTPPEPVGEIGRVAVPWLSCYSFISDHTSFLDDIPEGTVEPSDFFWRWPSQILPSLSQRVDFWTDTSFMGMGHDSSPVSLNITDIAHDLYNRVPLSHSTFAALRRSLNTELIARYMRESEQSKEIMKEVGLSS